MEKDREIELKVNMFCSAVQSNRKLCDNDRFVHIMGLARQVNEAFEELKK